MSDNEELTTGHSVGSTLRSRLFASKAAAWLEHRQLSEAEIADRMDVTAHAVSSLLAGDGQSVTEMAAFLALCGVTRHDRARSLDLAAHPHRRTWFEMTDPGRGVLGFAERTARYVTTYHPLSVPDLAQAPSYARAMLAATPTVRPDLVDHQADVDSQVDMLKERQAVLQANSPGSFLILVPERALRTPRASRTVVADQIKHLAHLSQRPRVQVLVVPDNAGLVTAREPFTLFSFPQASPVVCLPQPTSVVVLEELDSVAGYQRVVSDLCKAAMSAERFHEWVDERALAPDHDLSLQTGLPR